MRRLSPVVFIGLLCALVGATGLGPAAAQEGRASDTVGIRLVDAPSNRADDPRARLYIVDHLAPGTTINRRVELSNDTDQPQEIHLYAAAATIEDGEFQFGEGREANDLTGWTTVSPSSLTLPAGENALANVKIEVPADATSGEQYGVVWAEMRAGASGNQGIAAVNRVGVRMYLSVGPGGEPPTDFEVTQLRGMRARDGSPVVEATVRNTGGRAVDLSGELTLANGPGGLSAGPFDADLGTTLGPGQSAPVLVTLDRALPNGPWDAHLEMRSGTTVRETEATITFPDAAGTSGPPVVPQSGLGRFLVIGGGVSLLILFLLLFLFFWKRRKKKEDEEEDPPAPLTA